MAFDLDDRLADSGVAFTEATGARTDVDAGGPQQSDAGDPPIHLPEALFKLATRVAKVVGERYAGYVDRHDLYQEACEWACRNNEKALEYLGSDEGPPLLFSSMRRHVRRFAEAERAALEGEEPWKAPPTLDEVAVLLPCSFRREAWHQPPEGWEERRWLESLADCAEAYRRLDDQSRAVLELRFRDGSSVEPATVSAAVKQLHDDLSGAMAGDVSVTVQPTQDRPNRAPAPQRRRARHEKRGLGDSGPGAAIRR